MATEPERKKKIPKADKPQPTPEKVENQPVRRR